MTWMGSPKEAVGIASAAVPVAMEGSLFPEDAAGKETAGIAMAAVPAAMEVAKSPEDAAGKGTAGIATAAVPGAAALPGFANSLSIRPCFE